MNLGSVCFEIAMFGNHPRGASNCIICQGKYIPKGMMGELDAAQRPQIGFVNFREQNQDFLEQIYMQYQDCPCCKGLVYDCQGTVYKNCVDLGQCWCQIQSESH